MRDWPLLLVSAVLLLGATSRYIAVDGASDLLSVVLTSLGSAAFGAWLFSVGVDTGRYDKHQNES